MGMEVQLAIIVTSSILTSICCIVWLVGEFTTRLQKMVEKLVKELDKGEK